MKYKYILFDLDGTVTQSAQGIRASLEHALSVMGVQPPNLDDYTLYIGPPLIDTFRNLCGLPDDEAERGSRLYRDYYNTHGKYMNKVYDGIPEVVKKLRSQGARLAVCTSKYEKFAEEILELVGLKGAFDAVCGSNLDGSRKDKKDLIPYAVKSLGGSLNSDRKSIVMLGDTWFDAQGARLCGVDFIGALYGYGSVEAMQKQGAKAFAETPQKLLSCLL
ncbi:MAG TPA: phosphoglycolate phosphatase [Ruminococcaceae bacterium]|nr:phosphoglycolate phosphatase [Oscillospiraceae bacterium]